MLNAVKLKTEYLVNPIGIDARKPEFGWNLEGTGKEQSAYEIRAAHTEQDLGNYEIWNSGIVKSSSMQHHEYGRMVYSRERIYWQVRITDESGEVGEWSKAAFFEMGLLEKEDWAAKWMTGNYEPEKGKRYPVDEFQKVFEVGDIHIARMYITACGLYETKINGKKIGNQVLMPGCTSYDKRVQYQTYDITEVMKSGKNTWEISLGDGWFRGKLGVFGATNVFGSITSVLGQIEITKIDGSRKTITTDGEFAWCNDGPIRFNDMKDGEIVDASMVPSYDKKAITTSWDATVSAFDNVPVLEHESFNPEVLHTPDGSIVLDFGQNIAGYVAFYVKGQKGHKVNMVMGEMLDENGNFTLKNLVQKVDFAPDYCDDTRFQMMTYICGTDVCEYWKPKFCMQGFRYAKLENWPEEVKAENFKAISVYSDMEHIEEFSCSNKMLEQLVKNTLWSIKGNFLDVPTDCPTRERAAWAGDAQLFFDTGCYFMDTTAFFRKWMQDIYDDQAQDGKIYNIVPRGEAHVGMSAMVDGSSGWVDAGILIPYRYWLHYREEKLLKKLYQPMKKLANFLVGRMGKYDDLEIDQKLAPSEYRKYIVMTGFHFGEWNEPGSDPTSVMTPKYEEATAYLIYTLNCFSKIAKVLGENKDADYYNEIAAKARKAYQYYFVNKGVITEKRMCKYVRPLALNLLDESVKKKVEQGLIELVREQKYYVGTGFLSTPFVLKAISDAGYIEDAYRMLENEEYPSWLYEVKMGATTIWENWDGSASRNHYSNGAVCSWIFDTVCGISIIGENQFKIAPKPGGTLTEASLTYQSIYGEVKCSWKKTQNKYVYEIHVPSGCTAEFSIIGMEKQTLNAGEYTFA